MLHFASTHQLFPKVNIMSHIYKYVRQIVTHGYPELLNVKIDWLEGIYCESEMSKNRFSRWCRKNKAGIQHSNYSQMNNLFSVFKIQFQSFCSAKPKCAIKTATRGQNWKGIQENTSSSNTYRSCMDQGAMCLGGYSSVYVCRWGLPFFSKLYHRCKLLSVKFVMLLKW